MARNFAYTLNLCDKRLVHAKYTERRIELEEELAEETEALNRLLKECATADSNDTVYKGEKKEEPGNISQEPSNGMILMEIVHR